MFEKMARKTIENILHFCAAFHESDFVRNTRKFREILQAQAGATAHL
jgi:hypothetical protein